MNKFCADEFCSFFYGYATRDQNGWPLPIYGRYDQLMKRARLLAVEFGELQNMTSETRPQIDFNHIVFKGNNFDAKIPLGAGLIMGEAKLPYGHPSSEYATWRRTKWLESNLAISPELAAATAAIALAEIDNNGLLAQWPTYTFRDTERVQVGDILTTTEPRYLTSVNEMWFRADRIQHTYSNQKGEGRTANVTASLRRLSRRERIAYLRANGLSIPL